jgi:hypothetical protein
MSTNNVAHDPFARFAGTSPAKLGRNDQAAEMRL